MVGREKNAFIVHVTCSQPQGLLACKQGTGILLNHGRPLRTFHGSGARMPDSGMCDKTRTGIAFPSGWLYLHGISHFVAKDPPALEAGAAVTASEDLVRGASDWEKLREKAVMCIGCRTDPRVHPLNPAATLKPSLACGVRATVAVN